MLIVEQDPEISALLVHMIARLGHDPVEYDGRLDPTDAGVVVLDPSAPGARSLAERIAAEVPDTPLVCLSIYPRETIAGGIRARAHIEKPFTQQTIADALALALA